MRRRRCCRGMASTSRRARSHQASPLSARPG
jgi:hypothetical protein